MYCISFKSIFKPMHASVLLLQHQYRNNIKSYFEQVLYNIYPLNPFHGSLMLMHGSSHSRSVFLNIYMNLTTIVFINGPVMLILSSSGSSLKKWIGTVWNGFIKDYIWKWRICVSQQVLWYWPCNQHLCYIKFVKCHVNQSDSIIC